MEKSSILEKYNLFHITKDNQPKFEASTNYNSFNKFNKCTVLQEMNITYYSSTESLKKN